MKVNPVGKGSNIEESKRQVSSINEDVGSKLENDERESIYNAKGEDRLFKTVQ